MIICVYVPFEFKAQVSDFRLIKAQAKAVLAEQKKMEQQ